MWNSTIGFVYLLPRKDPRYRQHLAQSLNSQKYSARSRRRGGKPMGRLPRPERATARGLFSKETAARFPCILCWRAPPRSGGAPNLGLRRPPWRRGASAIKLPRGRAGLTRTTESSDLGRTSPIQRLTRSRDGHPWNAAEARRRAPAHPRALESSACVAAGPPRRCRSSAASVCP